MKRRCLYLHHILQQNKDSLLSQFFIAQMKNPRHGDWASQVLSDLDQLEIHNELEEIQCMSQDKYNKMVTENICQAAFKWLQNRQQSRTSNHARGKELKYSELKMANYLCPSDVNISIDEKKWLFKCRVEDIEVKANRRWQNDNISCLSCNFNVDETQSHILTCTYLIGQSKILTYIPSLGRTLKFKSTFEGF